MKITFKHKVEIKRLAGEKFLKEKETESLCNRPALQAMLKNIL